MRSRPEQHLLLELGRRVADARRSRGLTQEGLGELVGLDASSVSRVERGKRWLSFDALVRLARVLGVSLGALLDLDLELPVPEPASEDADLLRTIGRLSPARRELLLRLAKELAP